MTAVSLKKKIFFLYLSFLFACILFVLDILNYATTIPSENPNLIPLEPRLSFLVAHAVCFLLFLLGYIYACEAGTVRPPLFAFVVLATNIVSFILRVVYELVYLDYHPTQYNL
eukprot:TRINITY_DN4171_c0_g2_i1.p1 TRINITY_DN4171_c0_g2~~TRINITY_DN4171_c0_g2_i1.p1  ORF type:complete len:113 (+),score=15.04 TRINITY_DN4171_c0_g2_i1:239-577(+)